jgi:hypothetical protein
MSKLEDFERMISLTYSSMMILQDIGSSMVLVTTGRVGVRIVIAGQCMAAKVLGL